MRRSQRPPSHVHPHPLQVRIEQLREEHVARVALVALVIFSAALIATAVVLIVVL